MKKSLLVLFVIAAAGLPAGLSQATVACPSVPAGYTLVAKTAKAPSGTVDAVDSAKVDRYTFALTGAGDHQIAVQPLGSDVDTWVCKGTVLVCRSGNVAGVPDGCILTDDTNGENPGVPGPAPNGAGTYTLYVLNCAGTPACGYPGGAAAPQAYAVAWQ